MSGKLSRKVSGGRTQGNCLSRVSGQLGQCQGHCPVGECLGDKLEECHGQGTVRGKCLSEILGNVRISMQDYKSLHLVVMICDRQTDTQIDKRLSTGYTISSAS